MEGSIVEWLRLARMDIATSRHMFDTYYPKPLEVICFHAQQAAEKMLKCYLISQCIEVPKTHDLQVLCDMCIERHERFNEIYDAAVLLTRYAVIPRYPAEIEIIETDAVDALLHAETVMGFVDAVLAKERILYD
jgi:HEPN domain-containing protein